MGKTLTLKIQDDADVQRGVDLLLGKSPLDDIDVIQFSFNDHYWDSFFSDSRRDEAKDAIGSKGDQAVTSKIAAAMENCSVPGLHIRFAFCNLSEAAILCLAEAVKLNQTLRGFSCFQNPCNFPNGRNYDASTRAEQSVRDALVASHAPLEIWNNNPLPDEIFSKREALKREEAQQQLDILAGELIRKLSIPQGKAVTYAEELIKQNFETPAKLAIADVEDLVSCGFTRGDAKFFVTNHATKSSVEISGTGTLASSAEATGSSGHIMVSFNVATLGSFANTMYTSLERDERTCWICTQSIPLGVEWRDAIQSAVERSSHFVMLINDEWLKSGECQHEYKIALALYNKHKRPKMLPVIFPDVQKKMNTGVLLGIAANFNCINVDAASKAMVEKVLKAL